MKKILITILIIVVSQIQIFALFANVELTGKELLIEFQLSGPSTAPPGIYAYDFDKNELKIVMPFATNPKWSPDHKKIGYNFENITYIFDITNKTYQKLKIDSSVDYEHAKVLNNFSWIDNDYILWLVKNMTVQTYNKDFVENKMKMDIDNNYKYSKNKIIEKYGYISSHINGLNSLNDLYNNFKIINQADSKGDFSGQIEFDTKSKLYVDCIQLKKKDIIISSSIFIGRSGWDNFDIIKADSDEIINNPKIQPGGSLILYESLSRNTGAIDLMIYDILEKKSSNLLDRLELDIQSDGFGNKYKVPFDYTVIGWTPDGQNILFEKIDNNNINNSSTNIMNIISKKIKKINFSGKIIKNSWSSGGDMIAVIIPSFKEYNIIPSFNIIKIYSLNFENYKHLKSLDVLVLNESKYKNLLPISLSW